MSHVFECRGDLPKVRPHSSFIYELLFHFCLLDKLLEIALFSPFNNNEHFIVFYEALNVSDYEIVLQLFKEFDLLNALLPLLLIIHIEYLSYAN
jgi:hypothetical protein